MKSDQFTWNEFTEVVLFISCMIQHIGNTVTQVVKVKLVRVMVTVEVSLQVVKLLS